MSYWPELLIESYHLLLREATALEATVRRCALDESSESLFIAQNMYTVASNMRTQAEKIKKRMKSLGYYDCWEKEDDTEVVVP